MAGASIFRASQTGDIFRVKELVSRGQLSRQNRYGCTALHYAVKHAAECAVVVARGGDGTAADQSKVCALGCVRVPEIKQLRASCVSRPSICSGAVWADAEASPCTSLYLLKHIVLPTIGAARARAKNAVL